VQIGRRINERLLADQLEACECRARRQVLSDVLCEVGVTDTA
jgi:hypothetical protein